MEYRLVTSNEKKLAEFNSFGLDLKIEKGLDLPEIDCSDPLEVIIHKSKDAGIGTIVEDTTVNIAGTSVVDIRYRVDEMKEHNGKEITWITYLAKNKGQFIHVFAGKITGTINVPENIPEDAFAFDPYFIPDGETKSLYEFDKIGEKTNHSARRIAAEHLMNNNPAFIIDINQIKEWTGNYQK